MSDFKSNKQKPIKLHHFGEALISEMINDLGFSQFKKFLEQDDSCFCPGKNEKEKARKLKALSSIKTSRRPAESMKKMELKKSQWATDTEHDIDVAIMGKKSKCFPIEVKMGTSGVVSSWAKFEGHVLKNPMKKRKSGGNIYIDGSMTSFLSGHKSPQFVKYPHFVGWGLCIRLKNKKNYVKIDKKTRIDNLPLIFVFEELVVFYNLKKGKDALKTLVQKILKTAQTSLIQEIIVSLPKTRKQ